MPEQASRRDLYVQAQKIFHKDAPWVPIAHSTFMVGIRKNVENFILDPLGYHVFEGVDLSGGTAIPLAAEPATVRSKSAPPVSP